MDSYMGLTATSKKGLVSVVITTYNSASTIFEVLNALLEQEYPLNMIEVIVVDGCSYDNTLSIVREFKKLHGSKFHDFKIIIHERNLGVSKARNDGIKASSGEYILILDSDVVLPPNAIMEMVSFLNLNPDVGCCVLLHKPDTNNTILRWQYEIDYGKNRYTIAATSAAMLKRDILEKTGLYNETLGPPFSVDEDLEFGARIWRSGYKVVKLGNVVAYHLTEKRDIHLMKLSVNENKIVKKEETLNTIKLIKWFIGYFREKQGLTWYMFLKSLPLKNRLRIIFHSMFMSMGITLLASLVFRSLTLSMFSAIIMLVIFLDVLRDYYSFRNIHKACVITLLACLNRSTRTLSTILHILKLKIMLIIPAISSK